MTRFTGATVLAALALRTDRIRIPAWTLLIGAAAFLTVSRSSATDVSAELTTTIVVPVAVMSVLLVTPHLLGAERSGRLELVSTGIVGRYAPLTGGLSSAVVAIVCTCALLIPVLASAGLDADGAVELATGAFVVGSMFAALAALISQMVGYPQVVNALALAVLAATCLLRSIAAVPFGSLGRLIGMIAALACLAVAYWAAGRRDLGHATDLRLGRRRRRRDGYDFRPAGPLALAVRRQQWPVIAWGSAVFTFALGAGGLHDWTDASSATLLVVIALLAAGYVVSTSSQTVRDEARGTADAVLSAPLSRSRWFGAQIAVTAVTSTCIVLFGWCGVALGTGATRSDVTVWSTLAATVHLLPALAVVIGIATWCHGHAPRAVNALWGYLAYVTLLALFGDDLPEWAGILSPFAQLPLLPAEDFTAGPPIALAVIGGVFTVLGIEGFRRRDILQSGDRHQSQLGRVGEQRMSR